jgi:hypothetical protein
MVNLHRLTAMSNRFMKTNTSANQYPVISPQLKARHHSCRRRLLAVLPNTLALTGGTNIAFYQRASRAPFKIQM